MAKGITKAQRELQFVIPADLVTGTGFVDSGQSLSIVNRKLFSQKKVYGIEKIEFDFVPTYTAGVLDFDFIRVQVLTAGDTWSVHNAWVKGHALHTEMQALVLDDNPSIKGKWAEYKVFLSGEHRNSVNGAGATGNLIPVDGLMAPYLEGEWTYSRFVVPQHEIDLATGEPKPADETDVHLIGPNIMAGGATPEFISAGLVEAYALSRATVQPEDPAVPAGMSDSFFNQLTDSGSQEPELAQVIESENDEPPYDQTNYPGGATNAFYPVTTATQVANVNHPNAMVDGMLAQCGLLQFVVTAQKDGEFVATPELQLRVTYAPGMYKGVAAIDMGQ